MKSVSTSKIKYKLLNNIIDRFNLNWFVQKTWNQVLHWQIHKRMAVLNINRINR